MSVENDVLMDLQDETLDAPTQVASSCAKCFVCVCVGINDETSEAPALEAATRAPRFDYVELSDETLDSPTQVASSCAKCFVCVCVGVGDEALEGATA